MKTLFTLAMAFIVSDGLCQKPQSQTFTFSATVTIPVGYNVNISTVTK